MPGRQSRRIPLWSMVPKMVDQVTILLQQVTTAMERLNGHEGRIDRLEREAGDDRRAFAELQAYVRANAERTDLRFDQLTQDVAAMKDDLKEELSQANAATPAAVTAVLLGLLSLFGIGFLTVLGWLVERWLRGG